MKNSIITLIITLLISISSFAQQGIGYKAVIKDDLGNTVANHTMKVRFIIEEPDGSPEYIEVHDVTSDVNGLIILNIGEGTPGQLNDFNAINWKSEHYKLEVGIDLELDGSYIVFEAKDFKTVPYALSSLDNPWVKNGTHSYTTSVKTGVNTDTPEEVLDVNGRIKVGDISPTSPNTEGSIRYNTITKDFEGWNGSSWLSLTKSSNGWGNQSVIENSSETARNFAYDDGTLASLGDGVVKIHDYSNGVLSNVQVIEEDSDGPYFSTQIALHGNILMVSAVISVDSVPVSTYYTYVYVFEKQGGTWVKQTIISDPANVAGTNFGVRLEIYNNRALISDPYYNSNAGRVYLFELTGGNWTLSETFYGLSPASNLYFGADMSILGNNICISELGNNKIYLYENSNSLFGWVNDGSISNPEGGQNIGYAVDLGNNKLAVTGDEHRSYIYEKVNGSWPATPSYTIDQQGTKVKILQDYLLLMTDSTIYLFEYNNGSWGEIAQLRASNSGTFARHKNFELTDDHTVIANSTVVNPLRHTVKFYYQN